MEQDSRDYILDYILVRNYISVQNLRETVAKLGLPEGSSREDVSAYYSAQDLKETVARLRLPEGSGRE